MEETMSEVVETSEAYARLVDIARVVEEAFDVRVTGIYEGNEFYCFQTLPLWPDRIAGVESEMLYYAVRPSCPHKVDVHRVGRHLWLRFTPR
jgi:hypothetical protein